MSCRHSSSPKDRPKWQGTEVSPPNSNTGKLRSKSSNPTHAFQRLQPGQHFASKLRRGPEPEAPS